MRLLHRLGVLGASAAIVAIGLAAPASAAEAPPADGVYSYAEPGHPAATWTLQSVCSQASGTRQQSDYSDPTVQTLGCVVNVASSTPEIFSEEEKVLNSSGRGRLADGLWTVEFTQIDNGEKCPDGRVGPPVQQRFEFSEVTLTGTRTTLWGDYCGRAPGMTKSPFTLSFLGPLDPPVEHRTPMQCDYLAGRPSICS